MGTHLVDENRREYFGRCSVTDGCRRPKERLRARISSFLFITAVMAALSGVGKADATVIGFQDSFPADTKLNSGWLVDGPVAQAALPNYDAPPASLLAPTFLFNPLSFEFYGTPGMEMILSNGNYQQGGIQTVGSFAPPFVVEAQGQAIQTHAGSLQIAISNADASAGVSINGGVGANQVFTGFEYTSPNGPNTYWGQSGKLSQSAPSLADLYNFTISVGQAGVAALTVTTNGQTIGTASTSVGEGPFYLLLSEGSGAQPNPGPNEADWEYVTVTCSADADCGKGFPAVSPNVAAILENAVTVKTMGSSGSNKPTAISASFTPANGMTLEEAAQALGVSGFDWQQTITSLPSPSLLYAEDNRSVPLTAPPSFFDPVNGGYTYCNNINCANDYPFYYDSAALENGCSEGIKGTNRCQTPIETNDEGVSGFQTLNFFDSPYDPCLPGGNPNTQTLHQSLLDAYCGGKSAPAGSDIAFITELVGFGPNGDPVALPFTDEFIWSDDFNGVAGTGVSQPMQVDNPYPVDSTSGVGGITILSSTNTILGSAGSPVPEPSSLAMLATGIGLLVWLGGVAPRMKKPPAKPQRKRCAAALLA